MTIASRLAKVSVRRSLQRQSYLFALALLGIGLLVMLGLNPRFFRPAVLNGNLRTYLPLMLLAAGQAVVVMSGGIDLSAGAIVSLVNVVVVTLLGAAPEAGQVLVAVGVGLLTGLLAGIFNGLCVAYLRFQPIVTTFASSFVFGGMALSIMPSPGGSVPAALMDAYRANPLGVPLMLWVAALVIAVWSWMRGTRWGHYLFAVGGQPTAAYLTGVPVNGVRMASYALSGLMAACAAFALILSTGTGDALIGGPLTLSSIVAVVLGGTRLSGGQGGVAGALIGVVVLGLIRNIISFANVPLWWQTFVDSFIILVALAGPALVNQLRHARASDAIRR